MSNWGNSLHEVITSYPSSFVPLAIAVGVTGTGSQRFADGSSGVPYILARGVTPSLDAETEFSQQSFEKSAMMAT